MNKPGLIKITGTSVQTKPKTPFAKASTVSSPSNLKQLRGTSSTLLTSELRYNLQHQVKIAFTNLSTTSELSGEGRNFLNCRST
jgi:hypothetical protein